MPERIGAHPSETVLGATRRADHEAGSQADHEAGRHARPNPPIAHGGGDCRVEVFERSPLHIEVYP
jgi:hypothetical protein